MKISTRVLGMALLLVLVLTVFPITAGARGFSNITGTQPEQQQRHGFDVGKPSAAEPYVPGATRARPVQRHSPVRRRSSGRRYSSPKKYASPRKHNPKAESPKKGRAKAARAKATREETTVILSETEPPKHVFISKINPSASETTKQKDPMQTPKTRRVADFLMMGIAGFSILAALLYVFTAHRNK